MQNKNNYFLLQNIMQGKMEGKRDRGREIPWLGNPRKWYQTVHNNKIVEKLDNST